MAGDVYSVNNELLLLRVAGTPRPTASAHQTGRADGQPTSDLPAIRAGAKVTVTGLKSRPEFNGRCGTVVSQTPTGRWEVRLEAAEGSAGTSIACQTSSLQLVRET